MYTGTPSISSATEFNTASDTAAVSVLVSGLSPEFPVSTVGLPKRTFVTTAHNTRNTKTVLITLKILSAENLPS